MSPDGSTKPLPEEKLLGLIRGKGVKAPLGAATAEATPASHAMAPKAPVRDMAAPLQQLQWPKIAIGFLGIMLAVQAVALVIVAIHPVPTVMIPMLSAHPARDTANTSEPLQGLPSLAASASRTLFAVPVTATAPPAPKGRGAPSGLAKLLAARLTLMGIVSGEPAQAIIEDTQTKRSYFVTTGQVVVEGAVLKKILDNRVVLDLDGEEIELTL